jgi:Response regulator containing CheY-like receiver, AAA-type ATPase, and DNA-binding domains
MATINVLVAGKSDNNLSLAKEVYDGLGYQVIPAHGLALSLFLAQKNYPDLIIADCSFRDGDGMAFLTEIKADPELAPIPFVFMVDDPDQAFNKERAIKCGALEVLFQPVAPQQLAEITLPLIEQRLQTKEAREETTPE